MGGRKDGWMDQSVRHVHQSIDRWINGLIYHLTDWIINCSVFGCCVFSCLLVMSYMSFCLLDCLVDGASVT